MRPVSRCPAIDLYSPAVEVMMSACGTVDKGGRGLRSRILANDIDQLLDLVGSETVHEAAQSLEVVNDVHAA